MNSQLIKITVFIFVLLCVVSAQISAQDEPVRVETNLVTLNVAVTDNKGNYIRGLDKSRFLVIDNGRSIKPYSLNSVKRLGGG